MINRLRNLASDGLISIGALLLAMTWLSGICLHLYTILYAFQISGFIAAAITLVLPLLSQIFWVARAWSETGELVNSYSYYVFVYMGYVVFSMLVIVFGSFLHKEKK